jgi:hypothetical protein
VWAGSHTHKNDRNRSLNLDALAPLTEIPGVHFFSLQKGTTATVETPPKQTTWSDFTSELNDFADTAALVQNLDLVITVDTSVAHLAGAMGKPTWTLLAKRPEWRWMLDREDSPWYPTMRLFRQSERGNWEDVITRVIATLEHSRPMSQA